MRNTKASSGSRDNTVLGTPAVTSYGLFHQQPTRASVASSRNAPNTAAAAGRSSASSLRRQRGTNSEDNAETDPVIGSAANDGSSSQHSNDLLERHTSAAKDGVIDMLTAKASKLGASLERVMLSKKEVEDSAGRLQVLLEGETTKRKGLEHILQQKEVEIKASTQKNEHLNWEVDALRVELQDAEQRSKGWLEEEVERRRSVEDAMNREHVVATKYLAGVYHEGGGPEIRTEGGATVAEVLVRELRALGEALQERDGELGGCTAQLEEAVSDAKAERARRETIQEQLVFTQERFEATKQKVRQLSSQLEVETGDCEALRARLQAMQEENDIRTRNLHERKAKAQQRKRGDTRDMMAESKAKDDRIKGLESTLMKERARLEGELQSARSDYEEAAKESRRKTARLQRRCLELEYRVATLSKGSEANGGGGGNLPPTAPSSSTASSTPAAGAGLISSAAMLPWRRGSAPSETSTSASTTSVTSRLGSGTAAAAAAAAADGTDAPAAVAAAGARRRGGEGRAGGGGGGGAGGAKGTRGGGTLARSNSSSSDTTTSGFRRASADRLPDPSRHNEGAPAWMRADLAVDRVRVD